MSARQMKVIAGDKIENRFSKTVHTILGIERIQEANPDCKIPGLNLYMISCEISVPVQIDDEQLNREWKKI